MSVYRGYRAKVKVTGAKTVAAYPVRGRPAFDWKALIFLFAFDKKGDLHERDFIIRLLLYCTKTLDLLIIKVHVVP